MMTNQLSFGMRADAKVANFSLGVFEPTGIGQARF